MSHRQIASIRVSCHCGLNASSLLPKLSTEKTISLCHCPMCRYSTGQLCTSYLPIHSPESILDAENLVAYLPSRSKLAAWNHVTGGFDRDLLTAIASQGWMLWFCKRCGSHVYSSTKQLKPSSPGIDGSQTMWEVATGCLNTEDLRDQNLQFQRHVYVLETRDGGLAKWLLGPQSLETSNIFSPSKINDKWLDEIHRAVGYGKLDSVKSETQIQTQSIDAHGTTIKETSESTNQEEDILQAGCQCGRISFHITRPNEHSTLPTSAFSDLIKHRTPPNHSYGENPRDEKWWLRPSPSEDNNKPTRYFAGTCVCESCRLSAGFEIQAWAFIPRTNIFFHLPSSSTSVSTSINSNPSISSFDSKSSPKPQIAQLDFSNPEILNVLGSYQSREDVTRHFCPVCGATVFWTGKARSELIDVSVGILRAEEGAMAREWLEWCGDRVSFMEEVLGDDRDSRKAGNGEGEMGREGLVRGLLDGLRAWNNTGEV